MKTSIKTFSLLAALGMGLTSPLFSQVPDLTKDTQSVDSKLPALSELIASFNAEVERREVPGGELNNRRVGAVEEAIKMIEAAKDHPPLRSTTSASKR